LIRYLKREFSGSALDADVHISITAFHGSVLWLVSVEANGMNLVIIGLRYYIFFWWIQGFIGENFMDLMK